MGLTSHLKINPPISCMLTKLTYEQNPNEIKCTNKLSLFSHEFNANGHKVNTVEHTSEMGFKQKHEYECCLMSGPTLVSNCVCVCVRGLKS